MNNTGWEKWWLMSNSSMISRQSSHLSSLLITQAHARSTDDDTFSSVHNKLMTLHTSKKVYQHSVVHHQSRYCHTEATHAYYLHGHGACFWRKKLHQVGSARLRFGKHFSANPFGSSTYAAPVLLQPRLQSKERSPQIYRARRRKLQWLIKCRYIFNNKYDSTSELYPFIVKVATVYLSQ